MFSSAIRLTMRSKRAAKFELSMMRVDAVLLSGSDVEQSITEPQDVPYIKHVPPDVTAALFWLRNRDPRNWRENHHLNVTSDDSTAISIQEAQAELLAKVFGVVDRHAQPEKDD
jgi:hypothetical protein